MSVRKDIRWQVLRLPPWVFSCRQCGRRYHHGTWERAMAHAAIHSCTPGELW